MNLRTPRIFAIFWLGGTLISALMIWLTTPLLVLVAGVGDSLLAQWDALGVRLIAALGLGVAWVMPGQLFVATAVAIQFSFLKRLRWPFVVFVMIPAAALLATYRDIADCCERPVPSDVQKLLYWTMIMAPAELICAWYVSKMPLPLHHQQLSAGEP
ncbi:hypothetical protein SSBR45G_65670 [Bradyrhizobium sp. SSBR45G]|uniref:hypothetical protein n=1 Tax=unclassified Bradyrhizobium TaxID=2631580 RepID=UPI002342A05A|nr:MULTISPECIES: hypothetical protein [unclassified Bradyrhizobium]GLH81658.1 hypothetical protein SSBR45G_65670 [Bradyrhizobium sp. SSBR45G]GLH89080.1 hypothetical protein SSBR45R_65410 [Bradyrhizobium sp. SSBR45R]